MNNLLTKLEVREIRVDLEMTQEKFASFIGVSKVLVAMTETGIKTVSRHYLQKIVNATGVPITVTIEPQV